jgi:probable phosphoglycerate mutase
VTAAAVPGTGRRLVLLRHGRTAWNAQGRAQGQLDVELDDLGHEQARTVGPVVASMRPSVLWSSDLARARQTSAYVAKEAGLEPVLDPRLREFDVGRRQGLTMAEFASRFPAEYDAWQRDHVEGPLGGESTAVVAARMREVLTEVLDGLEPGQTAVVVSHGAALKTGLIALLGWPHEHAAALRGLDNCCWLTLEETGPTAVASSGGRLRLTSYNSGAGTLVPGETASAPHAI